MNHVSLAVGEEIRLRIEKPAAGGWMIARQDGQVVLVSGAIPGETVVARIERSGRGVVYARTLSIAEPSSDRREPFTDPLCGGCLYAHVAYPRQLTIKSEVIADAFSRIARLALPAAVVVTESPLDGYRMRARLHVRAGRIGFFREGSHDICDARATRQLLNDTADVVDRLAAALRSLRTDAIGTLEISENVDATGRVLHLEGAAPPDVRSIAAWSDSAVTGVVVGQEVVAGDPHVTDSLLVDGRPFTLRRHVQSFFQGNRFLIGALVAKVIAHVPAGAEVVDFYAGVGLFAIAAANARGARVIAVEGDRAAARDLDVNARGSGGAIEVVHRAVESFTRVRDRAPDVVIIDPPRTGMSRQAFDRVVALGGSTLVYVSCDVATLARDARRLTDAGYRLTDVDAFDLFPNTPHVEAVVKFVLQT
jgi:23S rRNA (uracil1939-C5)-methyltransferase